MNHTKEHWENVYAVKSPAEVSWTQNIPAASLALLRTLPLPKTAAIIDVGGGDSRLADCLLDDGFTNVTVLDISGKAIERAKQRLGKKAAGVNWQVQDIRNYKPGRQFNVWHDRATFHFHTSEKEIESYITLLTNSVVPGGYAIIATFSQNGPEKCSGLTVSRYSAATLTERFKTGFDTVQCFTEDHLTPFNTTQNFLFCCFKRKGQE
ncbi:MAG TPA: class I SAM-dependent methyltransferase [Chitinophagaceae bacterium]|nr:class I SAM-dependent methyltransferase [Chitinophagaceae bacterium]